MGAVTEVFGNRYEVIERVGDGGMATVYRGVDRVLKRDVAIKVMHPHLAARNDARARFNREAQAIARLHHGNIVDVYDFSVGTDEAAFLVTEFVHGETLTQFVADHGPFLPQAAALIGHAVAAALGHAHAVGIVHRDIKPDNLMISRDGQIKLMDFGIATAVDLEQMTASGAIVGSPAHMAPEQIEGGEVDHRCDIFAFGTVLYHLVTRKLPFAASNPHALFRLILEGRFDAPSKVNPIVDRTFDAIIAQCLARNPADRYPSMVAVQSALAAYLKLFRMSDTAGLLQRFLKAPEVFQFDLRPTLVQVLTAEGKRYTHAGQLALAIDAFNRALVVEPEADEPKKALSYLTSRSKHKRQLRMAVQVLALAGLLGAGGWLLGNQLARREVSRPLLPSPTLKLGPVPGLDATRIERSEAQHRAAQLERELERLKNQPLATIPLPVAPTPVVAAQPPRRNDAVATLRQRLRATDLRVAAQAPVPLPLPAPPALPKIDVHIGSQPPNATLVLDGVVLPREGACKVPLEPGSVHKLRCKFPRACAGNACETEERPCRVPAVPPKNGGAPRCICWAPGSEPGG